MYCPNCGLEYAETASDCGNCDVALVSSLPHRGIPLLDVRLETVFESTDPGLISIAKSILSSANIEFLAIGEDSAAVFAGNPFLGRVRLQVESSYAEEANLLLDGLTED